MRVLILCITYRSDEDCVRFVKEICGSEDACDVQLIVVDNGHQGDSLHTALQTYVAKGNVVVLSDGTNRGYLGGAAWGLERHLSKHALPEWVVVCNADLHLAQKDFFARLSRRATQHVHAIVAPSVLSQRSGQNQNPFMERRPNGMRMRLYALLFASYPLTIVYVALSVVKGRVVRLFGRLQRKTVTSSEDLKVIYAPHGACMAFRRSYFDAGGTLSHGAFLFGEEIFVAESARRLRLSVAHDPQLIIEHKEHIATGLWPSRLMLRHMRHAADYCATFFR